MLDNKMEEVMTAPESPSELEKKIWEGSIDFISNQELKEEIEKRIHNPENFVGEGGTAMVIDIGEDQCVKLMENRHNKPDAHKYDLGNCPEDEVRIQNSLRDLNVNGVFVPAIFAEYHGHETSAIFMEKFDAANLQLILNGEEEMPDTFSFASFSDDLRGFIIEMHNKKSVAHADLEPRNVLVDRKTGKPRVIDFGRSKFGNEMDRLDYAKLIKKDNDKLQEIHNKLDVYIKNN